MRRLYRAPDFADDMAGTAVNGLAHFAFPVFELASGHVAEGFHTEVSDGFLALCPALGIFTATQLVLHVGVNDE